MAEVNEDELFDLRRRAYGRDADIHEDPAALRRLQELEVGEHRDEVAPQPNVQSVNIIDQDLVTEEEPQSSLDEDEPQPPPGERIRAVLGTMYRRIRQVRRSHALICIGVAVVAMSLIVVMVVIQRVQVDPLQVGATQVARLTLDPSFETPAFFSPGDEVVLGFESFHGLRAVVSTTGFFVTGGGQNDNCLSIYFEADMVDSSSTSFTGFAVGGCAAGTFPAIAQFRPDAEGFPEELRSAFPKPAALQFVYDVANNEVVVFTAPAPDFTQMTATSEPSFGPPPEVVLVGEDLVANPPERPLPITGTVVSATSLGERGDYGFIGAVNDENQVCLIMRDATRDEDSGVCTDYLGFQRDGVRMDRGPWQVTWWADGRVEFEGI